MPDRRDGGTTSHRFLLWVLLFAIVGLGMRLALQKREWTLSTDSFQYLLLARSIASGEGYVSGGGQHPDVTRLPLYPIAVAAASKLTGGIEPAANLVAALAGALIAFPLSFLARDLFGTRAGYAAAPLAALSCLVAASSRAMPTTLYALICVGAAHAAYRAARGSSLAPSVTAGLWAGLAPLTRPEGLLWPVALALWAVVATPRGAAPGRFRRALVGLAVAAAVYAPFVAVVSSRLGRFSPAPGLEYLRDIRFVADRFALRYVEGDGVDWTERSRFLLSSDHRRLILPTYFQSRELLDPDPKEARLDLTPAPGPRSKAARATARRHFGIALRNELRVPRYLYWEHFIPPIVLGLMVIGAAAALRRAESRVGAAYVLLPLAAALTPAMSHLEPRFFYPVFAFGLLFAARGWAALGDLLPPTPGRRAITAVLHGALLVAIALEGLRHPTGALTEPARRPSLESIARDVRPALPEGPMLSVQPALPYLCGRPYRALPLGSLEDVLAFASAQGARSIAFEGTRDLMRRPELAALLADPPPKGLKLLAASPHPQGGEARVFAIEGPGGLARGPDAIVSAETN